MSAKRSTHSSPEKLLQARGVMRLREFEEHGLPRAKILRMADAGQLQRIGRGLYGLPDADFGEHQSLVVVAKRVPEGIVCLLSALRLHGLTTQNPSEVYLGLDRRLRKPSLDWPSLRVFWWSGEALTHGLTTIRCNGVDVTLTTPARTVADCFKYRNKIGIDIAIEALKDFRQRRAGSLDDLHRAARTCRVERTIRPYLEAIQ